MTASDRVARVAGLIAAVVLSISCTAVPESPRLALEGTSWELEAGTLDGRPLPMVPGHRITLAFEGTRISGTSACNHYGMGVSISGGAISLGLGEMTAMGCEPAVMASETEFMGAMRRVSSIASVGDRLILRHGGEVELRFAPLAAAQIDAITDRVWVLELLVDAVGARAPRGDPATLELRADGSLRGSTGSRALSGSYVLRDDEILATALRADGADPPPALADQDGYIVNVIGDGFRARVEDGRLILSSTGNQQLVYGPAGD